MADEEAPNAYTVVYKDGDKETVQWLSRAGNARVTYPNGDTYEGTFNEMGQRHGSGEYTYKSAAQDGESGKSEPSCV